MFNISIETGGSAFGRYDSEYPNYEKRAELARILDKVIADLNMMKSYGVCRDINGNRVGQWEIEEDN